VTIFSHSPLQTGCILIPTIFTLKMSHLLLLNTGNTAHFHKITSLKTRTNNAAQKGGSFAEQYGKKTVHKLQEVISNCYTSGQNI